MEYASPDATSVAGPPFFGTFQTPFPGSKWRPRKTLVEFRARDVKLRPSLATSVCSSYSNVALTEVSLWTVTWQVAAFPLQAPPQPMNRAVGAAAAASVTVVPGATCALQVAPPLPHVIPAPVI